MKRYKICVYAICKNEEQFVDRWMDAVGEADIVIVLDTGSTDNTVEKLKNRGALVFSEEIKPWRFDVARNIAMSHIPEDVDICVSNDLDEVFELGWRNKLELAWNPKYTRARYKFTWSYNADGTPSKQFDMEKVHQRNNFKWVHPVHEVLEYTGEDEEQTVFVNGMILNHYPDLSKPRSQYLSLLELSTQENPTDPAIVFWLGREYMYKQIYDKAIETLEKHLLLPETTWDEERSASMRFISICYEAKGNLDEAKKWLLKSIAECQRIREPYLQIVKFGYKLSDWPLVYAMSKKGMQILVKTESYLEESESWNYSLYDYAAIASYQLGLYEEAQQYAKIAFEFDKEDDRLRQNLYLIESKLKEVTHSE